MPVVADIPACLELLLRGYDWKRNEAGQSGGAVYRLSQSGCANLYLKSGRGTIACDITDEMVRLRWLAGRLPVPEVCHFVLSDGVAWLLISELPGRTAYQLLRESDADQIYVVDALVDFLRLFHALPADACPFNSDHHLRLVQAEARLKEGLIDCDDFDEERSGWTADQIWNHLMGLLPLSPDDVVTHGDFSLDNILMNGGTVVGVIDVGRVGIADRYQDLAILWNCLGEFDGALRQRVFTRYGIVSPDERKLDFHLTLDECF